jgi:isopenicillin-N epimerase
MPSVEPPEPIAGARLLFSLDPTATHLNHGSFGAVPIPVQRAQQRLRDEVDANPMRFFTLGLEQRIAHVRRHLAAFLGADPETSALVDNATTGTSMVLASLDLQPGDEIVTSDHGYGSTAVAIADVCRRTGAVQRVAELPLTPDDDAVVSAFRAACSGRTRLVVIDAITSATARRLPVARVVAAAHGIGAAALVDAAHVPGAIDADVQAVGADFWVGNFHKWAFAPRGTALLCVSREWAPRLRPLVLSWSLGEGFPAAVEFLGARDYTPWLAAPTGTFVLRSLGVERVREHNARLAGYGRRLVAEAVGDDRAEPDNGLAMKLVRLPGSIGGQPSGADALRRRISDDLGVEVAINAWRGRGLLRLSANVYNRPEDYQRLAQGLPHLLR